MMRRSTATTFLGCVLLVSALLHDAAARMEDRAFDPYVPHQPRGTVLWYDDLESGAPGWSHGDLTADATPAFHVTAHNAWSDGAPDTAYSWWCGRLDDSFAGGDGYGNDWRESLELPPIDLGDVMVERVSWGAIKAMYREGRGDRGRRARDHEPVLTFDYRHDSEPGYDFTWIEIDSLGAWVRLAGPYHGSSDGWQSTGAGGISLSGSSSPARLRVRFESDGAFSDEDGLYDSDGGAFSIDNVRVFDALTGEVLFDDRCDGGEGLCIPATDPPAGDYWRLEEWPCQAYSDSHVWVVCWPDTAHVQPNLKNWLQTPVVDIGGYSALPCTAFAVIHFYMSGLWGGYVAEESTTDGGATWTRRDTWYGDQCDYGYGPCQPFLDRIPVSGWLAAGDQVAVRWVIFTDSHGNSGNPDCSYQSAGLAIDDTWIEVGYYYRGTTWNSIRAMYR